MGGKSSEYLDKVSKNIIATFPSRLIKTSINHTLGYYLAVMRLVDMQLLEPIQAYILIADTVEFECVQINPEVVLFTATVRDYTHNKRKILRKDAYSFKFMRIWLEEMCSLYNPVRWPK